MKRIYSKIHSSSFEDESDAERYAEELEKCLRKLYPDYTITIEVLDNVCGVGSGTWREDDDPDSDDYGFEEIDEEEVLPWNDFLSL